jgi:WD40-like Beta Propeller Repeat
MTDHTDVRDFLRQMADEVPPSPVEPRPAVRRAKRRLVRTLSVATLVLAALVAGSAVGIGRLTAAPPSVPAHPRPSFLPTYHHNGDIAVFGMVDSDPRPCAPGSSRHGCAIIQIDPATGHEAPLTGGIAWQSSSLTWSPDGMELAYLQLGDTRLTIFHLSTGRSEDIFRCPPHTCELAWSPDGTTIAISNGDRIDLVSPDGTEQASLVPVGPGARIGAPAWLPDRRRIAFVGGGSALYEVDRNGTHLTQLGNIPKPSKSSDGAWLPAFSPDGSRIAYFVWHDKCGYAVDGEPECPLTLTVAPTDGSSAGVVRSVGGCFCGLGGSPGLAWSPDGKKLALVIPEAPAVTTADGIELVRVSVLGAWGRPAWRPVP